MAKLKHSTAFWILVVTLFEAIATGQDVTAPPTRKPKQNALYAPVTVSVIPGVERMTRGIDVTKLDLFPTEPNQANGFVKPVLSLSYEKNETWFNPSNGLKYKQPDEVSGVNTASAGKLTSTSSVSGESTEYKNGLSIKVGIDATTDKKEDDKTDDEKAKDNKVKGSFSSSFSFQDVQKNIFQADKTVAETTMTVSAIQVDFRRAKYLRLNEEFQYALDHDLTRQYEDMPQDYDKFVDSFGTHYFDSGLLGGYLYLQSLIENEYMHQTNDIELKVNLKAAFFEKVTITANVEDHTETMTERFDNATKSKMYYFGGKPSLTIEDPKFMQTWVPTVVNDPSILGGKLKPIQDLIRNETIKTEVTKAVQVKRARAYLKELKDAILFGDFQLSDSQKHDLAEVERMLASTDKKNLKFLIEDMDYLFRFITHLLDKKHLIATKGQLEAVYAEVMACKTNLGQCVVDAARREIQDKGYEFYQARQKVTDLLNNEKFITRYDHHEVKQAIANAAKMMYYHLNTMVDFCLGDRKCDNCVKTIMDPRNKNGCDNDIIGGLIVRV